MFDDSELVLAPGNIYGLIGRNGCGKTTLKMIANHEFPINDRMLILHVEQEIVETEKNPVELLMASNGSFYKHHIRIQELEEIMSSDDFVEMDNGDKIMEEYEQLESELRAVIPEAEEAKIRKILKGLGFTESTMEQPSNLLVEDGRCVSLWQRLFILNLTYFYLMNLLIILTWRL